MNQVRREVECAAPPKIPATHILSGLDEQAIVTHNMELVLSDTEISTRPASIEGRCFGGRKS
jgi:hypothetical protein